MTDTGVLIRQLQAAVFGGGVKAVGAFSAGMPSAVTIGTGPTKMTFTAEDYDVSNWYDAANSRYTPLLAGYYRFNAHVRNASATAGQSSSMALYKNGVLWKWINYSASLTAAGGLSATATAFANGTTDFFEIYLAFAAAGQVTSGDVTTAFFQGEYIGTG